MKISKKSEYALKALLDIALNSRKGVEVTLLHDIAKRKRIPHKYLEHILLNLKNSGILISKRGVGGGYSLARLPESISLGDILRASEGTISEPQSIDKKGFQDEVSFVLNSMICELQNGIAALMDSITLKDMTKKTIDMIEKEKTVENYII